MPSTPTVLLCTSVPGVHLRGFREAARRLGIHVRVVSDRGDGLGAPWAADAVRACFDKASRHVEAVLEAVAGTPVDGVLATDNGSAWLAAHVARARGLAWHAPEAVAVATDRLLTRGRLLAVGLPVPWFVSLPARGEDDLDRLTRVRFPCVVAPVHGSAPIDAIRVDSLPALMAARDLLAGSAGDTVLVDGLVAGQAFALDGVLEQGALRVFALFERPVLDEGAPSQATAWVTPARMDPAHQHVVAGHVARAALALGLHHGPIHAECRVDGDAIVVRDVWPRPLDPIRARVVPVVAPDRTRCGLEDVLIAHALGHALDHYGHQAIASGVVTVAARGLDDDARAALQAMPWVTAIEDVTEGPEAPAVCVFAQGAQPDDVIATLGDAARRLRSGGT